MIAPGVYITERGKFYPEALLGPRPQYLCRIDAGMLQNPPILIWIGLGVASLPGRLMIMS
jgi:hypothetical protein